MTEPGSLKVGDRVRFIGYETRADFGRGLLIAGTVTAVVPEKGGCMVRPDGYDNAGGFGWSELELISSPAWDHLMADDDFSDRLVRSGVVPE